MNATGQSSSARVGLVSWANRVPEYELPQHRARHFAERFFANNFADEREFEHLLDSFEHAEIQTRHLAAPVEWLEKPHTFVEKNAMYTEVALALSRAVGEQALADSGIARDQIGAFVFASSTGIATPSLDARLIPMLELPRSVERLPLWGLGCAGGVAGMARSMALARGLGRPVLLIACELCSLTFVHGDRSKANVIAVALFGDGAGATVIAPEPWWNPELGPELVSGYGQLLDGSEQLMGWDLDDGGLRVRFAPTIPSVVREHSDTIVKRARRAGGLTDEESIAHWVLHPGGRKVLQACQDALSLTPQQLLHSRSVLRDHGNMSGPTVLFVLESFLRQTTRSDLPGLLMSFGPGFCAETVVFRW